MTAHPEPEVVESLVSVYADVAPTLEQLLDAANHDDGLAFAELYERTSALVYRMVVRVLRDHAQAAEVTQDVYLDAWEHGTRFSATRGSAITWLLTIAHRRAVDRVRSSSASSLRDQQYARTSTERPHDQVVEQVQLAAEADRLRQALTHLSDVQRQAVTLAYLGGYTHAEIAELLQIPLGTVKARIRGGFTRLRASLRADDAHPA